MNRSGMEKCILERVLEKEVFCEKALLFFVQLCYNIKDCGHASMSRDH